MQSEGWSWFQGTGLVAWLYLHPTCKGMKKMELYATKEKGVDYFDSEESLQFYARVNLGWRTKCAALCRSEKSPEDAEMADRIKKRKRGASLPKVPKPAAVEAKKSGKGKKLKGKAQADINKVKKTVKKATSKPVPRPEPSSPESVVSDDESRFSETDSPESGVSRRTRSNAESSPTVSELEADNGVKLAKKKRKGASAKLKFQEESGHEESSVDVSSLSQSTSSASGSSGSEQSSTVDASYRLLPGIDAWHLLMDRFGFSFANNKYCLPGKENRPGKDSTAVEGVNYFGALADLRKHLCAYGLPEIKPNKGLQGEDIFHIDRWVRYAHVIGLQEGQIVNPADIREHNGLSAWTLLAKLGLRYSGGTYVIPTQDPTKPAFRFERQPDYLRHLARFGVPRVEGYPKSEKHELSKEDRLGLDLFLATSDEVDTL